MSLSEFEINLKKYADVAVRVGLNLQPGQRLSIAALIENAPLVRAIAESAYEAGARFVNVVWDDEQVRRTRFEKASVDTFDEYPTWIADEYVNYIKNGDALLSIFNPNPDLFEGMDVEKVNRYQTARFKSRQALSELTRKNTSNWLIIAAPTTDWAAKVLPDLPEGERIAALWELIFKMCRVTSDDPVANWKAHAGELSKRRDYLNEKAYNSLKLSSPGTDLTVGLPKGHVWRGANMRTLNNIDAVVNVPTEEVFTMPEKTRVDGTLKSTKPLNWQGMLMDDFQLRFENGKMVEISAGEGEEHLRNLSATDAGASFTGEIALVPHSSPISKSGRMFYNTLYDENASCHIAMGNAYRFSMEGGTEMTDEEFEAAGGNQSMIHIDFMIGSGEMDVDGITEEGKVEPVMRAGEWAFEV